MGTRFDFTCIYSPAGARSSHFRIAGQLNHPLSLTYGTRKHCESKAKPGGSQTRPTDTPGTGALAWGFCRGTQELYRCTRIAERAALVTGDSPQEATEVASEYE